MSRRTVHTGAAQQHGAALGVGGRTVDLAAGRTVDRNRRQTRSQDLVRAVQALDTTTDPAAARAVMEWVSQEYESRQGGTLLGLFGRCFLGAPYVDHRLDLGGSHILEHYTAADQPPPAFGAARPFARSDAYIFIEVYDDGAVVPVRADGRPVI